MTVPVWILVVGATLGIAGASLVFWARNRPFRGKDAPHLDGQVYSVGKPSPSLGRWFQQYKFGGAAWTLAVVLALTGTFAWAVWSDDYSNERWLACLINGKDYGKGNNYRLYTSCGVLENKNAWLRGKRNSPEIHAGLELGCTYRLRVAGSSMSGGRPNVFEVQYPPIACA